MCFPRPAIPFLTAALSVVVTALAAAASEPITETVAMHQVMATVHQFIDGFNRGDTKAAVATCAAQASIIDEFPPHAWHGTTACADWARDFKANSASQGITGGRVDLGMPWHVDVSGNSAYVVAPASFTYQQHGKRVTESGSIFTVALEKVSDGWRIAGWAWSAR